MNLTKDVCLEALEQSRYLNVSITNEEGEDVWDGEFEQTYIFSVFEQLINEHFKPKEHTINFKYFKLLADSTLRLWSKEALLEYIHTLHNNWKDTDLDFSYAMDYVNSLQSDIYRLESKIIELHQVCKQKQEMLDEIRNNQPLKLEELQEGMWVWDNQWECYIQIEVLNKGTIRGYEYYTKFEENRFYKHEVRQ